ncbi:hypothetical protein F9U39_00080 [Pectobacterium versatile]|uniref:hypothetical protein n=1 Tax=Pectobacterium versatile TaxID=2488639 RepID=UPI001B37A1F2|nr:hypothetical protein [Pectobacterium versatile]MBQ4787810.1 hypothetical protein [Pectobacterium versatile]
MASVSIFWCWSAREPLKRIELMINCKIDYCGALPIKQIIAVLLTDFYTKSGSNRTISREWFLTFGGIGRGEMGKRRP